MKLQAVCFWTGWFLSLLICGVVEVQRLMAVAESPAGPLGWAVDWNLDTTLPFITLMALPVLVMIRRAGGFDSRNISRRHEAAAPERDASDKCRRAAARSWSGSFAVFALSLIASTSIGLRSIDLPTDGLLTQSTTTRFWTLPPAYHDEFSYLLQARTFLAGRVAWPAAPVEPQLFHQMHVLSEPVTASRYFPWTGVWMMPFVAMESAVGPGAPYAGQWLASALAAMCMHRCLIRLIESPCPLIGGVLIAVCPGIAVFSNLLLAHQPTLLALSVFLLFMLRWLDDSRPLDAAIAGATLTLAMLGRPMTAAGFAAPIGIVVLLRCVRAMRDDSRNVPRGIPRDHAGRSLAAIGLPICAGLMLLAAMNQRITGDWRLSPYQLYTDTWTPRHGYGFNNVERGERVAGATVLDRYDRWATNLTPAVAVTNVRNRCLASSQWTLGLPALVCLLCSALPALLGREPSAGRFRMIAASVICLHVVHVPYWFDGILHWHYVFETAPLLLMLATAGICTADCVLRTMMEARWSRIWLMSFIAAALIPSWFDCEPLWGSSRVSLAVGEQAFSRVRMEQFRRLVDNPGVRKPCLVMVDDSSADPQLSFIINPPDYQSDVLVCRLPADDDSMNRLRTAFEDRARYRFDPQSFTLQQLP